MNQPKQPKKKLKKRKVINVQKVQILQTERVSRYKKWQLKICKWIKVEPADNYTYLVRIQYSGAHSIKPHINNIIINTEGTLFTVIKESNRIAVIASLGALPNRPNLYGSFFIHESSETEKSKDKPKQK